MVREEDEEIPNDEEINNILARNEDELRIFAMMDQQRYEFEKRIYKNFDINQNYRLINEDETPEYIKDMTRLKDMPI